MGNLIFSKSKRRLFSDDLETAGRAFSWSAFTWFTLSANSYHDSWHYSELWKHLHLKTAIQAERHHGFPKTLPGHGTEHGNCSTLSFKGSWSHNVFSTGLDEAETDASCTTHVRLRTCNPSPHCPPYKMIEGNRTPIIDSIVSRWQKKCSWVHLKRLQRYKFGLWTAIVSPIRRRSPLYTSLQKLRGKGRATLKSVL